MTDLPEPLTPADCDLRGYDFMPVFGHRLFGSEFYARASDAEFRAAMRLWWSAWQQCPAGSLPADDAALALLADYGRDVKGFAKVKAAAIHGFVLCSDGRLYHPLLCQEAARAYERRVKERERKARFRARDVPPSDGQDQQDKPRKSPPQSGGCPAGRAEGRDAERAGIEEKRTGQNSKRAEPTVPAALPPPDARTALWTEGLARLRRVTGKPDVSARALLGRLCKEAGDDCALVSSLLHEAERDRPGDPVAWLSAAILARTGRRRTDSQPQSKLGWMLQ